MTRYDNAIVPEWRFPDTVRMHLDQELALQYSTAVAFSLSER